MDKTERETHDFMNVDSFSQLPFIRPAPPPKEKGIRLFGIEFGDAPPNSAAEESESAETITTTTNNNNINASALEHESPKDNSNNGDNGESSSRRFECHYCCRNFPTSQALGGHQNAHKRERQHAKRQHLQSAMVHGTLSEGHQVYGLMNYRFGSYASSPTMPTYPTWNNSNNNNSSSSGRFYGTSSYASHHLHHHHHHQQQQPINGSPLAMWRIPNTVAGAAGVVGGVQSNPIFSRDRSMHPLPLFAGEEMNARVGPTGGGSQNGYVVCDSSKASSVGDHVSLDLHL